MALGAWGFGRCTPPDRVPVVELRDKLNSALGQRFLDLSIVVDGPLLGKTVSKTVSQNYAFDQGGEQALILMSLLVQAEIFTGDFMVLNAYEGDNIKVLLPVI